ncbi:MAG: amidohydrolase family protein [Solirubrobacterales bacterium]
MSTLTVNEPVATGGKKSALPIIDCDVHTSPPTVDVMESYMPKRWQGYTATYARKYVGAIAGMYPRITPGAIRRDSWSTPGTIGGSDLDLLREQLLDAWNVEYGIMTPRIGAGYETDHEYAAAAARAINEWQLEWLEEDERLKASVLYGVEDPSSAVEEIHRAAADPRFVQILGVARALEPLGRKKYWPVYEAAVEHGLPVGLHFGGNGHPTTGAGWASYYYEDHSGMSLAMAAQVTSFVFEGIFDRLPDLKIVLIESGFAWIQPLVWRMEEAFARFRDELPHLQRKPSEYVRDHFWLTTQPIEEPTDPRHLTKIILESGADRLMFASDYPHWDFDAPDQVLPSRVPLEVRRQIMADNARSLYRLA